MSGDSDKSESVRMYFTKLRVFLFENQHLILQTMENKKVLKKYSNFKSIYFFVIDERKSDILKIGQTKNIINRLKNYN